MTTTPSTHFRRKQSGLSLVELMISITLGLLILAGTITIFANSSQTRAEVEKTSRQIENGRYAIQLLTEDLHMAGFLGDHVPTTTAPAIALPDPCATDLATIDAARVLHIQGYDNGASLSCISDVKVGTDVLVVRRASTCSSKDPKDANCDDLVAGAPYLQVSGCSTDPAPYYKISTDTGSASMNFRKVGCVNPGSLRRYRTHIYFIANNNRDGDGIPTLKRWELGEADNGGIVPLVEGIENLQLEYGSDTSGDGIPDAYLPDTSVTPPFPNDAAGWWNVMTLKISLLARNETISPDYTDTKTYVLAGTNYTPGGKYRRHAYTSTVKLANPAGRRE